MMLNKQQTVAKDKIAKWFKETEHGGKRIFTLAGYAGTGKTFLINYLIEHVLNIDKAKIATVTPTGKAASVLIQKGTSACTIHRLIYTCKETDEVDNKGKKKLKFVRKKSLPEYELIILDEVSMIGKRIMEDLIGFGIPILAVGDPGQLPPVLSERHDLLVKPDCTLTEIVRQSEDDPIIQVATMARNGEYIPYGKYGDSVYVVSRNVIKEENFNNILLKADQIICGKNETRFYLNNYVRDLLGFNSIMPEQNDKVICLQNNYEISLDNAGKFPLVNGNIGYVQKFEEMDNDLALMKFKVEFLEEDTPELFAVDNGWFLKGEFTYDPHQQIYFLDNGKIAPQRSLTKRNVLSEEEYREYISEELHNRNHTKKEEQICQFDYGYAISCHKAQGSEFDKVVLFDESKYFPGESKRWLYTAITRAKKKLIIIR